MGSAITGILEYDPITIKELAGKTLAVDTYNQLYMFLTTIRQPDGTPLQDTQGRVTSHLSGLFFRFTRLMSQGLRFAFVFDGKTPELKKAEQERRSNIKHEAQAAFKAAKEREDIEEMRKYASRTATLTKEMREEAIELIEALGCPVINAPSEGEAQAARLVLDGKAYAVMSQDADALLYGSPRTVKNLSITGRRKKAGTLGSIFVEPELILLDKNLRYLGISREDLICLAMLVGTDYNISGVKGIGPKKALAIVQEHKGNPERIFQAARWDDTQKTPWPTILDLFTSTPVTEEPTLSWKPVDEPTVSRILCDEHDFSQERVTRALDDMHASARAQKGLGEYF